jgi:hypothetical protein
MSKEEVAKLFERIDKNNKKGSWYKCLQIIITIITI